VDPISLDRFVRIGHFGLPTLLLIRLPFSEGGLNYGIP
jgi:hypothetical protein